MSCQLPVRVPGYLAMSDQADHLRALVQEAAADDAITAAPPLVVVTGGRPGVGATTAAVGVAIALCRTGLRVALVDADLDRSSIAAQCGVTGDATIAEVFSGRRTVQEALVPGPVGVQILPGSFAPGGSDVAPASLDRLLAGLNRAGSMADLVVLDLGGVTGSHATRLWRAADLVLLVTTTEPGAVMDAYAAVKLLEKRGRDSLPPSRAPTEGESRAVPAKGS